MKCSVFDYQRAFSRHRGLISPSEAERLRSATIALPGLGGVGGIHLLTLARLGIGRFRIADFDCFELENFNRQAGATMSSIGRPKIEIMKELALEINPELEIECFSEGVKSSNIGAFLDGADLVIDSLDFFAIEARRELFRAARERQLWVITAGPSAASASWLNFAPDGMSFDRYFDLREEMSELEKISAFAVGLVPSALHLKYVDLDSYFNIAERRGGSLGLACNLASGIAAAEALKILLGRSGVKAAPWYGQFDAYRGKCVQKYLVSGNRHPLQRLKRRWLNNKLARS